MPPVGEATAEEPEDLTSGAMVLGQILGQGEEVRAVALTGPAWVGQQRQLQDAAHARPVAGRRDDSRAPRTATVDRSRSTSSERAASPAAVIR